MNIKASIAKQKLQEIAQRTAKDIGYELGEIPKRAPSQLLGEDYFGKNQTQEDATKISPIVEAMQDTSDGNGHKGADEEIRKFIKDKAKVDEDIEKFRKKREELQREWDEGQNQMVEDQINFQPGKPLEIPTSKPSRGKFHPGKQNSIEKSTGKKIN